MKIGLISDVHANLPALEAVLDHASKKGVKGIWNLGDFVGYGPNPDEVIKILRTNGTLSILGNYDRKVLQVKRKQKKWTKTKAPDKWFAFLWAYEHLSAKSRKYLASLPEVQPVEFKDHLIFLVHGSPLSREEYLDQDTPDERLLKLSKCVNANIILCGHSHHALVRLVGNTVFINPGTVGRPDDGDPRASYSILIIKKKRIEVIQYRVEYDVERTARSIRANQLPEKFAQMLIQARNIDKISDLAV
jgi:putative phosphoesterase